MVTLALTTVGIVGLLVGSFLNVVVWRVPRKQSVVRPRSACPGCGTPIRARDNVPVVGWLLLRGRCRSCGQPIRVRYLVVEVLTAVLFVVVTVRFGLDPVLPAFLYLTAVGLALALIDLDTHRLPDVLTKPSYPVAIGLLGAAALLGSGSGELWRALAGGAVLFAGYYALHWIHPPGMGFGDVKLAGVLGLYTGWLGWDVLAVATLAGFLLGGGWGVAVILAGRGSRKTALPFGPFMLAGALLAVLAGRRLTNAYLDLLVG